MTPRQVWNAHFNASEALLPPSAEELDFICVEHTERVIRTIGVCVGNATFQSHDLQELRRSLHDSANEPVRISYNPTRLDFVWARDPRDGTRVKVPNVDPQSSDLSEKQLALVEQVRREAKDQGLQLTIAEARRRIAASYAPLLDAQTQRQRRKALQLLSGGMAQDLERHTDSKPKATKNRMSKARPAPRSRAEKGERDQPQAATRSLLPPTSFVTNDDLPEFPISRRGEGR